jgi:hypothetical protein
LVAGACSHQDLRSQMPLPIEVSNLRRHISHVRMIPGVGNNTYLLFRAAA